MKLKDLKEVWQEGRLICRLLAGSFVALSVISACNGRGTDALAYAVTALAYVLVLLEQVRADRNAALAKELARQVTEAVNAGRQWQHLTRAHEQAAVFNQEIVEVARMVLHGGGPRADR